MNREIKFRGFRTDGKGWVYGDLNQHDVHNGVSIRQNGCIINAVIPYSVGQFTGLKDTNGIEIYEGDVISYDMSEGLGEPYKGGLKQEVNWIKGGFNIGAWDINMKVIGNIHENENELLKL